MGMLLSSVGALSTFYPDAKDIDDPDERYMAGDPADRQDADPGRLRLPPQHGPPVRLPGQRAVLLRELPLDDVQDDGGRSTSPTRASSKALDVLFILHADHEQNCSTNAVRGVGSSQVDPYSAVAAGVAALYGPLHGGANEAVLRMLRRIETVENIPAFLEGVKSREERLMGFGHRVYKNYDPRARIIKKHCDEVFEVDRRQPAARHRASSSRSSALDDEYFISRKLYPNVDFYSGLIYEALGIPTDMFTVIFAIRRTPGWVAQWMEMQRRRGAEDRPPAPDLHGRRERDYVPIGSR